MRVSLSAAFLALVLATRVSSAQEGVLAGEQASDRFGAALRGVGDLNSDGLQDFAVGAPENDLGGAEAGRVYVYFGRAQNLPDAPDLTLFVGNGGDQFGFAVAGIGRFNADGFDDLAVAAPYSDVGGAEKGQVFIFYGGNPMNGTSDLTLSGVEAGDHFGYALAGGFDFNNDSFADVIAGSPDRNSTNGLRSGEARIFYGGSSPVTTAAVILAGDQALDQFGFSVDAAGDFNNDGFDDVIVGAPQQFQLNSGRAYVLFGRGTTNPPARLILSGEVGADRFGWSVAGGGNLDNDGYDDVAVGAPHNDFNATRNGAVYVFRGGSPYDATFDAKLGGRSGGDELGTAVSISGDFNEDGRSDLLAGAPYRSMEATDAGEVSLWLGGSPVATGTRQNFQGPRYALGFESNDLFGFAVDFVDYNGDGHDELVASSPGGNIANGTETGLVSILFSPGTLVPVVLEEMSIVPQGDRARLDWKVSDSDQSLLGFHVDRRQPEGAWTRLTPFLLVGDPTGRFTFEDNYPVLALGGWFEYQLVVVTRDGQADALGPWRVAMAPSARPVIENNYPNPFAAPATSIPIHVAEPTNAKVEIFDAQGRLVRHLFTGRMNAGVTVLTWDGKNDVGELLPSGSYMWRFESENGVMTRKITLAR